MKASHPAAGRIYLEFKLDGDREYKTLALQPQHVNGQPLVPPTDKEIDYIVGDVVIYRNSAALSHVKDTVDHVRRQIRSMFRQAEEVLVERLTREMEIQKRISESESEQRSNPGTKPPSPIPPQP